MPDVTGAGMVHYAVEPERLSLSAYEETYSLELKAYGKVTDRRDVTVYQFEKSVPLQFSSEDLEELKRKRFSFQDVFPLLPGEYDFDLLLKNSASQEFTSFEKKITVPEPATAAALSPLVLGYRERTPEAGKREFRPFQFGTVQLYPTAQMLFTPREGLIVYFQVAGLPPDAAESGTMVFTMAEGETAVLEERHCPFGTETGRRLRQTVFTGDRPAGHVHPVPPRFSIPADRCSRRRRRISSSRPCRPSRDRGAWRSSFPEPGDPQYIHILGLQYLNSGAADKAALLFEECLRLRPDSLPFAASAIQAHYLLGDYTKVRADRASLHEPGGAGTRPLLLSGKIMPGPGRLHGGRRSLPELSRALRHQPRYSQFPRRVLPPIGRQGPGSRRHGKNPWKSIPNRIRSAPRLKKWKRENENMSTSSL